MKLQGLGNGLCKPRYHLLNPATQIMYLRRPDVSFDVIMSHNFLVDCADNGSSSGQRIASLLHVLDQKAFNVIIPKIIISVLTIVLVKGGFI